MAILNKDTSIGDINDVYDRLSSISPSGGGGAYVYNCIDGDNSVAINEYIQRLSGNSNTLIVKANPTQTITFNSGIDLEDKVIKIIFDTPMITYSRTSSIGFIKGGSTVDCFGLYLSVSGTTRTAPQANVFYNSHYSNPSSSYRFIVNIYNSIITGGQAYNLCGFSQMAEGSSFITLNAYNSYISGSSSILIYGGQDTSQYGEIYDSVIMGFQSYNIYYPEDIRIVKSIFDVEDGINFSFSGPGSENLFIFDATIVGGIYIGSASGQAVLIANSIIVSPNTYAVETTDCTVTITNSLLGYNGAADKATNISYGSFVNSANREEKNLASNYLLPARDYLLLYKLRLNKI